MKLTNHIATRFLTDETLAVEITESMHPDWQKHEKGDEYWAGAARTWQLVHYDNQRAYYITESVIDKLELLKVKPTREMPVQKQNTKEITGSIKTYDWSVFSHLSERKVTFIMPDNHVIRMMIANGYLIFCDLYNKVIDIKANKAWINWCMFWLSIKDNVVCDHWTHSDVDKIEGFIFRLLCFFYLSENEEVIVEPGRKHGTRKAGKIINTLPIPITIVNSKWNITSVRTEGFPVSGHFRLQPYTTGSKLIWIDPFQKHGYVRHAKKEDEI